MGKVESEVVETWDYRRL